MMRYLNICLLSATLLAGGCGQDNYEEPESTLTGRVTYQGEPLGLKGTAESVQLQLYQERYALDAPIPVYVKQDGTFEARLFNGDYKLVTRDNNGPWVNNRDTTVVNLNGTTSVDVEVTPYFMLSNVSLALSGAKVDASFQINQIVPEGDIEYAMLLVSKTSFVDDGTNIVREDLTDLPVGEQITHSIDLSGNGDFQAGQPLFARVGLKPVGTDQAIYSQVVQLR